MVPDVVGTMGMSSASVGIDQGIWNWGASSLITMFLWTKNTTKTLTNLSYSGGKHIMHTMGLEAFQLEEQGSE